MRYLLNSWEQAVKQDEPPVLLIPVVIYHGKSRWQYEPLTAYFGEIDNEFTEFLPEFRHLLYDISHLDDVRILSFRNKFLATSLFLMKHREHEQQLMDNRQALFRWLNAVLDTEIARNYLTTTIVYLSKNLDLRPKSFFEDLFSSLNEQKSAMSTYDQIIEEGVSKGLIQGRQEGRQEGQEDTLRTMLSIAYQQGIDISTLARQYTDLPPERVQQIVDDVRRAN